MKKYLLSILFAAVLLIFPASAATLFPVDNTTADGQTYWGYMNENGELSIPFQYSSASTFTEDGLALVTDRNGSMAVIDAQGKQIVPYRLAPEKAEFDEKTIAFRYASETVFFDLAGNELGTFPQSASFFNSEGLLPVKQNGLWGYMDISGTFVLDPQYRKAGAFSGGHAVVLLSSGGYAVIDTQGNTRALPADAEPVYMSIDEGDLIVVSNQKRFALYSFKADALLSDYIYQQISPFRYGHAAAQLNNFWGVLNARGQINLPFDYKYMSYLGEGVYAVRNNDGSVTAVDADGNAIYRTHSFAGGFEAIKHGISWHGTEDNSIIFFSKVGGYVNKLNNAEKPSILTSNVALVTMNGKRQYVRLSDAKALYSPTREYDMDYFKVTTTNYEKYLGMRSDGTEYEWSLTYPVISELANKNVQAKINSAIETFFLEGPSFSAQRQSLVGSYGLRVKGRLLVVWADCISGLGEGSTPWNDNITFDLSTGARYRVAQDLFSKNSSSALTKLLPKDIPYYLFSYPRITDTGVTFMLNRAQTGTTPASTQPYSFTFAQLEEVINTSGECWSALNGTAIASLNRYSGYQDVPKNHWAYAAIQHVSETELMKGSDNHFFPEESITTAEVIAVLVRALHIDTSQIVLPNDAAWYYAEVTAAEKSGLTTGLNKPIAYTATVNRADAMQILANAMQKNGTKSLTSAEVTAQLSKFSDAQDIPENRRAAMALLVKAGAIVGTDGKLNTTARFTRAQFAQILSNIPFE